MSPPVAPTRGLRVLLVEDNEGDAQLLLLALRQGGFAPSSQRVDRLNDVRHAIDDGGFDLVISDNRLPGFDALKVIELLHASDLDVPCIVVSGTSGEDLAVAVMKAGAHDFVLKGNLARLVPAVERELREAARREQQRRLQDQLMVSERMASVGMLAAGIAHEINNPLAAVLANLDVAMRMVPKVGDQRLATEMGECLQDACTAADRVRQIVRDVKIFSRGGSDDPTAVDVERVLDSSVRMAWNDIRHRARLVKRFGSVPKALGSDARLGQVFLNLLVNAAQAIPQGHADQHEIRVSTFTDGAGRVVVEIADTGEGMAPAVMKALFTPFYSTKAPGSGTGLGLAISRRIVTQLGGEIGVSSGIGQGTTFRVALPAAPEEPKRPRDVIAGEIRSPITRSELPAYSPVHGKILVVDDEAMLAHTIARALRPDHDVAVEFEGEQALSRFQAGERFDVILCDLQMPRMSGIELHDHLRSMAPDQAERMIFLSGGALSEGAASFLARHPERVVEKPFDRAAIVEAAARWLR